MKSILDPAMKYVPSFETNLRKTFARIRREQRSTKQPEQVRSIASIAQPTKRVM